MPASARGTRDIKGPRPKSSCSAHLSAFSLTRQKSRICDPEMTTTADMVVTPLFSVESESVGAESCNANAPPQAMFSGESKLSELAPAPGEEELCEASATSSFSSRIPSPFEAAAMDVDAPSGPKGGSSAPGRSWTEAEDQLLLTAIKLHGKSWAKAAEALAAYNRTMSMCRNRHQRLTGVVGGSKRTEAGNSTTTSVTPSAKPSKKQKTSKPPSAKPSPLRPSACLASPMHPAEMPPAVGPSALQLDVTSCENPARGSFSSTTSPFRAALTRRSRRPTVTRALRSK